MLNALEIPSSFPTKIDHTLNVSTISVYSNILPNGTTDHYYYLKTPIGMPSYTLNKNKLVSPKTGINSIRLLPISGKGSYEKIEVFPNDTTSCHSELHNRTVEMNETFNSTSNKTELIPIYNFWNETICNTTFKNYTVKTPMLNITTSASTATAGANAEYLLIVNAPSWKTFSWSYSDVAFAFDPDAPCGGTISSPGTYTMTSDCPSNTTAITITSPNVVLDCAGYSIYGDNSAGTYGVYTAQTNTTAKNCNISGYAFGVLLAGANDTLMSSNISTTVAEAQGGQAVRASATNLNITGNRLYSQQYAALLIASGNGSITNNTIFNSAWGIVELPGLSTVRDFSNNTITGCTNWAYLQGTTTYEMHNNTILGGTVTPNNAGNFYNNWLNYTSGMPNGNVHDNNFSNFQGASIPVNTNITNNTIQITNAVGQLSPSTNFRMTGNNITSAYRWMQWSSTTYGYVADNNVTTTSFAIYFNAVNNMNPSTIENNRISTNNSDAYGLLLFNGGMLNATIRNNTMISKSYVFDWVSAGTNGTSIIVANNTLNSSHATNAAFRFPATSYGWTIYGNNITAKNWVNDLNGTNNYNTSTMGNIWYNSTNAGAWTYGNGTTWTCTSNCPWADGGTLPLNATTFASGWAGVGGDWHPYMAGNPPIPNIPPNITACLILNLTGGTAYYNGSALLGWANATDSNNATFYVNYTWWMNGSINGTGQYPSYNNGTLTNIATITAESAFTGQNWTLTCQAWDGANYSAAINSTNATVQAETAPSAPVAVYVSITYPANNTSFGPGQCWLRIDANTTDNQAAGESRNVLCDLFHGDTLYSSSSMAYISGTPAIFNFTIPVSSNNTYLVNCTSTVSGTSNSTGQYNYTITGTSFCPVPTPTTTVSGGMGFILNWMVYGVIWASCLATIFLATEKLKKPKINKENNNGQRSELGGAKNA